MDTLQTRYASYGEIESQPEGWATVIQLLLGQGGAIREVFAGAEEVIFTGCGSGLNASLAAAPAFQAITRIPARPVAALELYKFPEYVLSAGRKTLVVLSSRSGQTTEVVDAMHYLHAQGIVTVGITCTQDSLLARESSLPLVLSGVTEQAVVTTRSLTGMILAAELMGALVGRDDSCLAALQKLPTVGKANMQACHDLGQQIGQREDLTRYAFVGNSHLFGIAHESQLKVKEMALLPSDSYPMLDFRHGPQSNVGSHMLVTAFLSDQAQDEEAQFLKDMRALGGVTWAICDRASRAVAENAEYVLEVDSGLGEIARSILYLPAVQFMAYYRAIASGLNPDAPHNLAYWIDTSH